MDQQVTSEDQEIFDALLGHSIVSIEARTCIGNGPLRSFEMELDDGSIFTVKSSEFRYDQFSREPSLYIELESGDEDVECLRGYPN